MLPADASQKIVLELEQNKRKCMESDDRPGSAARGLSADCLLVPREKAAKSPERTHAIPCGTTVQHPPASVEVVKVYEVRLRVPKVWFSTLN